MKEHGIGIIKARCKMSIYEEEINETASVCGMAIIGAIKCEGTHEDKINCPLWK
jgi:hypothetical protein